MARHARPKASHRVLLRAGLTITATAAALGATGAVAQAAPQVAPVAESDSALAAIGGTAGPALTTALGHSIAGGLGPATSLQLDPLAGTGVDPLDNAVATQIADFKPVSTALVTDHLTNGGALRDLPVVGPVTELVTGTR
ncbi:hypothetical protein [uncultured Streptomyces sp.]|uniref:hypothetical protein n=1 Tax=uncultured Streptomyces sp. TaxID=174707 RepID=UPI00260F8BFC|nr:hypothetical protein [uncultured Streptomyces sp.]